MVRSGSRIPLSLRLRRGLLRVWARSLFHLLARVRLIGLENIPVGTTYIAAINHISIYDPPLMMAFWPEPLDAIGAVDVFDKPVQGQIVSLWGTTPVHRGEYDRSLLETTLERLRAGRPMLIAPEGGRSHDLGMRRAKPGIAYLADEARVPVVPAALMGTIDHFLRDALHGRREVLEMRVGKPIVLPPIVGRGQARREARQCNADLVMRHLAGLLPAEYRGVYAESAIEPA